MTRLASHIPVLTAALTCALSGGAFAQEDEGLPDWQSWVTLEEEGAPEPPLLKAQFGLLTSIETTTRVEADRGTVQGSRLSDMEGEQGLDSSGFSPWIELSIGGAIRVGGDLAYLFRSGEFAQQSEEVVFDGKLIAQPGDFVKPEVEYLTAGTFLEWDFLLGETYRIGLIGGARYFFFDIKLEGVRALSPHLVDADVRAELLSPYFGGVVELMPFPYLSVETQVQFMNWSWEQIGLKKARYLRFRLGFTIRPVPGLLGVGLEYRFEVIRAEGRTNSSDGRQIDGGLSSNGVLLHLELTF